MSPCLVPTCKNNSSNRIDINISFHDLPKGPLQEAWLQAIGIKEVTLKSAHVCSIHFEGKYLSQDYFESTYGLTPKKTRLLPNAIPTLHLPDIRVKSEPVDIDENCDEQMEYIVPEKQKTNDTTTEFCGQSTAEELRKLQEEVVMLKKALKKKKHENFVYKQHVEKCLKNVLTTEQFKVLLNPRQKYVNRTA